MSVKGWLEKFFGREKIALNILKMFLYMKKNYMFAHMSVNAYRGGGLNVLEAMSCYESFF